MLILRPVRGADLDDLLELAGQLDSVNLPQDRDFLTERIARSERSFAGALEDRREAVYFFVLEDTERGRAVTEEQGRGEAGPQQYCEDAS